MSQYLILIYGDAQQLEKMLTERDETIMKGHRAFGERNGQAIVGGEALQPVSTATSLRQDTTGGYTVTDGPFVESKEALGGYYLIEAADLDEATELARQVPTQPGGGLEIRPIMVLS